MLVLNIRTIASIASISTTIQCVFWIIGYILYIIAYSCNYKSADFEVGFNGELPVDLSSYFVWYLQASTCNTTSPWLTASRGKSSDIIVTLLSLGLIFNLFLLGTSIYIITGVLKTSWLGMRINFFSATTILVSLWDLILLIIVGLDFTPLLDKSNYMDEKVAQHITNKPSILALAFFTDVFTIFLTILSRFFVAWFMNVVFALYLLIKNVHNDGQSTTASSPAPIYNVMNNNQTLKRDYGSGDPQFFPDEKSYFGNQSNSGMLKRQIMEVPTVSLDEVHKRWPTSSPRPFAEIAPGINSLIRNHNEFAHDRENMQIEEDQSNESDFSWHSKIHDPEMNIAHNVRKSDTFVNPEPKRPNIPHTSHESLKRTSIAKSTVPEGTQSLPKPKEGFSYINDPDTNIFGVKLRHITRPPVVEEQPDKFENQESGAYAVTPVPGIDPDFGPRESINFPLGQPANRHGSSSHLDNDNRSKQTIKEPPPLPPPDPLLSKIHPKPNKQYNVQISLHEAIKTRRPLKPVNRPMIDTTC